MLSVSLFIMLHKSIFFSAPALTPICAMTNIIFPLPSRMSGIPAEKMTKSRWTLLRKKGKQKRLEEEAVHISLLTVSVKFSGMIKMFGEIWKLLNEVSGRQWYLAGLNV